MGPHFVHLRNYRWWRGEGRGLGEEVAGDGREEVGRARAMGLPGNGTPGLGITSCIGASAGMSLEQSRVVMGVVGGGIIASTDRHVLCTLGGSPLSFVGIGLMLGVMAH